LESSAVELVMTMGGGVSEITPSATVLLWACTTVKQNIEMIPVINAGKRENIFEGIGESSA
jgi:hypothetical protein